MTIAFWCVLAAGVLPLVFVGYAKAMGGEYDNHAPRLFLARLTGSAKRAHWAEQNGYEAFPFFAASVLAAHAIGGAIPRVDFLALVFIVARVAHGIAYIADLATLRSFVWLIGWACTVAIFVTAATSR
jgi:uncharacterized MAPEG superfamily protein